MTSAGSGIAKAKPERVSDDVTRKMLNSLKFALDLFYGFRTICVISAEFLFIIFEITQASLFKTSMYAYALWYFYPSNCCDHISSSCYISVWTDAKFICTLSVVVTSCLQMKFEIKAKGSVTKYVGQVFCFFRPPTPLSCHFWTTCPLYLST